MAIIRPRGQKNTTKPEVVEVKKTNTSKVQAPSSQKANVISENSFHHSMVNPENQIIRNCWDTGKGFLLRKNQWIDNGCISENVETEDGVFHKCTTPPMPTDLTKVANYGLPREKQVWKKK